MGEKYCLLTRHATKLERDIVRGYSLHSTHNKVYTRTVMYGEEGKIYEM